jgi:hypothetical protein
LPAALKMSGAALVGGGGLLFLASAFLFRGVLAPTTAGTLAAPA